MESGDIDHGRRRFVEVAAVSVAAAATLSLLPKYAAAATENSAIRPFRIDVPEDQLADLRRRIVATRWPDRETVNDRSQGVQLAEFKEMVRYWGADYDWRKAEAKLNAFPQFITTIDDVDIHFIHVRSRHPNALPIIITHGWPGSVIEQLKIIDPLTDPTAHGGRAEDAFDVVIPIRAGLRLLRKTQRHRLGSGSHRARLGGADAAPRLHPIRRAGRRLGCAGHERDGASGCRRIARHPYQFAGDGTARGGGSARRRTRGGRNLRKGTRGARSAHDKREKREFSVLHDDDRAAANGRLWRDGLAGRTRGMDTCSSRLRAVGVRQRCRKIACDRRRAGQHHAVLADQ